MNKTIRDIIHQLSTVTYVDGDLSDVGNEIGIVLGNYIDENKIGYEFSSFISGLKHGVSLTQNTH